LCGRFCFLKPENTVSLLSTSKCSHFALYYQSASSGGMWYYNWQGKLQYTGLLKKKFFYKYYWAYGDVIYVCVCVCVCIYIYIYIYIYTEGRTLKVIFTPYKHSMWAPLATRQMSDWYSSSSHTCRSVSQVTAATASVMHPLQIIDIRTLRDFLFICTQDMDLTSVVFVKYIFESVYFFLNNSVFPSNQYTFFFFPITSDRNYATGA
jgi:hypothetical protein